MQEIGVHTPDHKIAQAGLGGAANISYNLLKTAAGGNIAIGPVLLGAGAPVHILTPSATVRRIVNMTALTVADANASR